MSGPSQWLMCGWAFVVAAFAIDGQTDAAATTALIIGLCCFFVSIISNLVGMLDR